jgi:hypothetical protein
LILFTACLKRTTGGAFSRFGQGVVDSEHVGTATGGTCSSRLRMTRPRRRANGTAMIIQSAAATKIHAIVVTTARSFPCDVFE